MPDSNNTYITRQLMFRQQTNEIKNCQVEHDQKYDKAFFI